MSVKAKFALSVAAVAVLHFCVSFFVAAVAGLTFVRSPIHFADKVLRFPAALVDTPQNNLPDWLGVPLYVFTSLALGLHDLRAAAKPPQIKAAASTRGGFCVLN